MASGGGWPAHWPQPGINTSRRGGGGTAVISSYNLNHSNYSSPQNPSVDPELTQEYLYLPDNISYNSRLGTLANFGVAALFCLKHFHFMYLHSSLFHLLQISAQMLPSQWYLSWSPSQNGKTTHRTHIQYSIPLSCPPAKAFITHLIYYIFQFLCLLSLSHN